MLLCSKKNESTSSQAGMEEELKHLLLTAELFKTVKYEERGSRYLSCIPTEVPDQIQ